MEVVYLAYELESSKNLAGKSTADPFVGRHAKEISFWRVLVATLLVFTYNNAGRKRSNR
jgi:hypothetical protein